MFFLIIPLVFFSASIIEDSLPLERDCLNDNYTRNSIFETNLKQVLNNLPSLTSPTGFNNHSFGESSNKVYGQALCRGDVNSKLCQDCVQKASQEILKCGTKEAIIWYQLCQARYSFQNFFGYSVYTGKFPKWNNQEKKMSDPFNFKKHVGELLHGLSRKAVSKPGMKLFATGKAKFSEDGTVYALVQCTRDISASDCLNCLQSASKELIDQEKEGGIVLSRNCNVRFELNCFFRVPGHGNSKTLIIAFVVSTTIIVILVYVFCLLWKRGKAKDDEKQQKALLLQEMKVPRVLTMTQQHDFASVDELPYIDLSNVRAATCNFSDENKLGRGGFGIVYKGVLPDGKEIAVKRLSGKSWQGLEEFKNEVLLIAKLQHRNLVRLLGYGMEEEEKLLIYEFMPNRSLDTFIFDSEKRAALNWKICYNIIRGIARGLLYLHEDSRLKIIHRDLKPSNILLDNDMVAKISDFGMARIFGEDQNTANTRRVMGTYGYMAPEYAMDGLFSAKSDVFSFGVIVLEIISGKKNSGFYLTEHAQSLLTYHLMGWAEHIREEAWRLWNDGKELELADSILMETSTVSEVVRCIHIGLLCVQEDPDDRPPMSSVVPLLGSEQVVLPQPKKPAFSVSKILSMDHSSLDPSSNHVTISCISPR